MSMYVSISASAADIASGMYDGDFLAELLLILAEDRGDRFAAEVAAELTDEARDFLKKIMAADA